MSQDKAEKENSGATSDPEKLSKFNYFEHLPNKERRKLTYLPKTVKECEIPE